MTVFRIFALIFKLIKDNFILIFCLVLVKFLQFYCNLIHFNNYDHGLNGLHRLR
jgi:hypothetical protein